MQFRNACFEEIGRSAGTRAIVKAAAEDIAATARSTAPVDTGAYRNGIGVRMRRGRYRDYAVVEGTDPKTMLIESTTGNIARALAARRGR